MTSDFIRLSLLGTAPSGEEWTINPIFNLGSTADITYADCNAAVAAINALTIPTGVRQMVSPGCRFTGVRVEARTVDGSLQAQAEGLRGAAVAGTGLVTHPFQTSAVFSLRTPFPGASGRGRLFMNGTGLTISDSTLRIVPTDVAIHLAGFKTWMTDIDGALQTSLGETVALSVWSRKNATTYAVTQILLGDIADTQRRRRDALPETYNSTTYPT